MTAIRRLVDVEPGDPETLAELLPWLVEQKAWKAVDELAAAVLPRSCADDAGLLYLLAEAYAEQGQKDRAEETAARAFRLYPGKEEPFCSSTSARHSGSGSAANSPGRGGSSST